MSVTELINITFSFTYSSHKCKLDYVKVRKIWVLYPCVQCRGCVSVIVS